MPVVDHPVHALTVLTSDRHGCHNTERAHGYWAPDRQYTADGRYFQVQTYIKNTMTKDCQWDDLSNPRCEGCNK